MCLRMLLRGYHIQASVRRQKRKQFSIGCNSFNGSWYRQAGRHAMQAAITSCYNRFWQSFFFPLSLIRILAML